MFKAVIRTLLLALTSAAGGASAVDGVVVIGHPNLRQLDAQMVAKRAHLSGTDSTERRREKRQHHRVPVLITERDRHPVLIHQREVRRFRSNVYRHEASFEPLGRRGSRRWRNEYEPHLRLELHIFPRFG